MRTYKKMQAMLREYNRSTEQNLLERVIFSSADIHQGASKVHDVSPRTPSQNKINSNRYANHYDQQNVILCEFDIYRTINNNVTNCNTLICEACTIGRLITMPSQRQTLY